MKLILCGHTKIQDHSVPLKCFAILHELSNIAQSISGRFCGRTSFAAPKIEKTSRCTCVSL